MQIIEVWDREKKKSPTCLEAFKAFGLSGGVYIFVTPEAKAEKVKGFRK